MTSTIKQFIQKESTGGILLMLSAVLAIAMENSSLSQYYQLFLTTPFTISLGDIGLSKALILWINDGLMAIFFLLVALEIKREFLIGSLSDKEKAVLPLIGALGGMALPALIYCGINLGNSDLLRGWAIPSATDIAFSLGILSLLGKRVPVSIKVLLTAIAVIDDLGAIVIIALFYTSNLSLVALGLALVAMAVLVIMNRMGVWRPAAYILVGIIMWVCVLKSGVHATLAGVFVGFCIPLQSKNCEHSPLKRLEHQLLPWVTFMILPIFGFANAGVSLAGVSFAKLAQPLSLGIILGLFIGKQLGIFSFSWVATKMGLASKPDDIEWKHYYGMSLLCGIGFTMSLFIGSLAFDDADLMTSVRLGVIVGSFLSGALGYVYLRYGVCPKDMDKQQKLSEAESPLLQ